MKCSRCRRPISASDSKRAVKVVENGKVKGMMHKKCVHVQARQERLGATGRDQAPSAYEMRATKQTKDDFTAEAVARRERIAAELDRLRSLRGQGPEVDRAIKIEEDNLALAERQVEIAEQQALEETPKGWSDYRDPTTMDL